jgi:branched-chain amino acid transport system permease protein
MRFVVQSGIDAISLGCLYALIALGIGLIFGIMRLVNFAHGELIMVGAYLILLFDNQSALFMVGGCVIGVVVLALLTERLAFRPMRFASPSTLFITSFAVSYLLQNIVRLTAGGESKGVSLPLFLGKSTDLAGFSFPFLDVIIVIVTVVLVATLGAFLKLTPIGIQMRAAAEDFRMAQLLCVRANMVIATAFAISGGLAAVVSLILLAQTGVVNPTMGTGPVLIGFVGTVVGGLGSLVAAGLGGFLVGFGTVVLQAALPAELRPFRDAFVFCLVIAVLVFRPQGLIVVRALRERI